MLKLAWKLVWGRRARAWLAVSSVAVGIAVVLVVLSALAGFSQYLFDRATGTLLGDALVTQGHRVAERRTGDVFDPAPALARLAADSAHVLAAAPRLVVPVLIGTERSERTAFLYGVDPRVEARISRDVTGLEQLDSPSSGDVPETRVLLSRVEAEALHLAVGDGVDLIATDRFGLPRAKHAEVAGFFGAASRDVEAIVVLTSLDVAGELLDARGLAHEVALALAPRDRALDRLLVAARRLAGELAGGGAADAGWIVEPWTAVAPAVLDYVNINEAVYRVFLVIEVCLVALAVADILWLGLTERLRDLGTVGALGARPAALARLVLAQAGLLLGFGVAIGAVLGRAAGSYIEHVGIPGLDAAAAFSVAGFSIGAGVTGHFEPAQLPIAIGVVLAAGLAAASLPAWRAARLEPARVLSHR